MFRPLSRAVPLFALLAPFAAAQEPRPLPSLEAATAIHDSATGERVEWAATMDKLAKLDVVFLGETHVDDTTHRVELKVFQDLITRRQGRVVLSMEMFEHDVQPVLDAYLKGDIDEATFLAKSRPWENYATAYRPLVETAKARKIPVVAANFPAPVRRRLAMGGKDAFDKLPAELRAMLPAEIFPAGDGYWERVDRAVRGHMGGGGGSAEDRLYDTQNLWDNAMGDNVAKALQAHPDTLVLHVAGGFHVAYRDGTVAQFVRRSKDSKFAVVSVQPTSALHLARPERDRKLADYVVYAETVARELNEGNWAVEVPAELRYRLDIPEGKDLPLLVWLPDRPTRTEDAFLTWQMALQGKAALVVLEPPFPELQGDLAPGGRYTFGDGYRADYTRLQHGVARIVEYVTRRFPVDGKKVVVAGAGDGGAAVLWCALYGEWLDVDFVAIDPNDLTRLSMEALPDQQPVARSLRILARRADAAKLQKIAADTTKVGLKAEVAPLAAGGAALAAELLGRLGVLRPTVPDTAPLRLLLTKDFPRAREWAELHAALLAAAGKPAVVVTEAGADAAVVRRLEVGGDGLWPVSSFANGQRLPLAGGPFGGTTVLVLPKGTSEADQAAWLAIEKSKAIKKRSMFANLAIACADGSPSLSEVVGGLKAKGKSRFLVVPAVFCADAATMRTLQEQLGDVADGLDLAWLPGLGAELVESGR